MPLSVLSDSAVREILLNLSYEDVVDLQKSLGDALHEYSTGDTNASCCASFQPERTVLKKKNATSLFMPSSAGGAIGVKVVTIETSLPTSSDASVMSKKSSVSSASTGIDALQLTPASSTSTGDSRSSISGESFRPPSSGASSQSAAPKGIITIMDAFGNPVGILNAEELTAFRTALGATFMLQRRKDVHTITVFGAGKIAYWHIRLALIQRHKEIHHVNIINRSFDNAIKLMKKFQPGHGGKQEWSHVKFSAVSPEFSEYGRLLKNEVRKADVIFCCTPSKTPLFPHEFLTSHEGRRKGRYISAVGSYSPDMIELHPEIIKTAVKADSDHNRHHHKHARQEGVVVVDTLDGCLKEAGEIIQAKITPDQLVEVGELIMVKRSVHKEIEAGGEGEKGLLEWLERGNVLYKSVGLGLMDLVVGGEVVRLGRERGIGTIIPDF